MASVNRKRFPERGNSGFEWQRGVFGRLEWSRGGVFIGGGISEGRLGVYATAGTSVEVLSSSPARLPNRGESGHWEERLSLPQKPRHSHRWPGFQPGRGFVRLPSPP